MLGDKKYIKAVNADGLFSNCYEKQIPQTIINDVIINHFKKSDKKPKCIFIGWDGCRADAMKYLVKGNDDNADGGNASAIYSAVNALKDNGGLYITYVGGDKSSPQETSTAQGWASALCGKWMENKSKYGIEWSLGDDYPTALRTLSQQGFRCSFSAIWSIHFDKTYIKEIELAENNRLPYYFYKFETDDELHRNLIQRIESDDDFIFGIYENPDLNGHGTGFGDSNYRYISGICNLDRLSYKLFESIKNRDSFDAEDWLVLIASDHGGHSTRHGTQRIEDRTTFLALSKPIEALVK